MPNPPTSSSPINSVMRLRSELLPLTTREFLARGSRLKRCPGCLLAIEDCLCDRKPRPVNAACAACFILYDSEIFKTSNTARLVADVLEDNHAFRFQRTTPQAELLALLADPHYYPVIVFPASYVATSTRPERVVHTPETLLAQTAGRKPLLVVPDGTWREARKIFNAPWLASLPLIDVSPVQGSGYQLRTAAHTHQLCTAEVVMALLQQLGDSLAAQALAEYFALFRKMTLKIRGVKPPPPAPPPGGEGNPGLT